LRQQLVFITSSIVKLLFFVFHFIVILQFCN